MNKAHGSREGSSNRSGDAVSFDFGITSNPGLAPFRQNIPADALVGANGGTVMKIHPVQPEIRGLPQLDHAVTTTPYVGQIFVSTYNNRLFAFERLLNASSIE